MVGTAHSAPTYWPGAGSETLSIKGQTGTIAGYVGPQLLLQLHHPALVGWKRRWAISTWVDVTVFQSDFICKSRYLFGFGLSIVCSPLTEGSSPVCIKRFIPSPVCDRENWKQPTSINRKIHKLWYIYNGMLPLSTWINLKHKMRRKQVAEKKVLQGD